MPSPTAWLALLEREGGKDRERKQREINTLVETAPVAFWFFWGERGMERNCERDSLAPVATVPAWAKGKRCCKMNKLLYYLPGRHNFLTVLVVPTPPVQLSARSEMKRNQSSQPLLLKIGAQQSSKTPGPIGSGNSCSLPEGKRKESVICSPLPSFLNALSFTAMWTRWSNIQDSKLKL